MGGGAVFGGGGHIIGGRPARMRAVGDLNGFSEDWMASTKKTIEDELKARNVDPLTISAVVAKVQEPPSMVAPMIAAVAVTALVCTLIFVAIWESTP